MFAAGAEYLADDTGLSIRRVWDLFTASGAQQLRGRGRPVLTNEKGLTMPLPVPRWARSHTFPPPPNECPYCGQVTALAITCGFPSAQLQAEIQAGTVVHRGCLVGPDDADWSCQACGYE